MALKLECEKYLSRTVYVMPYTGAGWQRLDHARSVPNQWHGMGPAPFNLYIRKLIMFSGQLEGFEGTITEKDHFYDNYYCSVINRYGDALCDLYQENSAYNIAISKSEIRATVSSDQPMFDWFRFDLSSRSLFGYGGVYPTKEDVKQTLHDQIMTLRKEVPVGDSI